MAHITFLMLHAKLNVTDGYSNSLIYSNKSLSRIYVSTYNSVLGQAQDEFNGESLPKIMPIGSGELDIDATVDGSFSILHSEGCLPCFAD